MRVTTAAATRKATGQPTSPCPPSGHPRPGLRRPGPCYSPCTPPGSEALAAPACGSTPPAPTAEIAWKDGTGRGATGGSDRGGTGRGATGVAGGADPATGFRSWSTARRWPSAVPALSRPLWAGLVCRLTQALGAPPRATPAIHPRRAAAGVTPPGFREITTGSNGAYTAGPGWDWDTSTGLGVPNGRNSSTMCAPADDRAALVSCRQSL